MSESTTEPLVKRGVFVTKETRERLRQASYASGLTMAELVRRGMDEFLADPTQLTDWSDDPGNGAYHFHFSTDAETWDAVKEAARKVRSPFTPAVRRILLHVTETALYEEAIK